MPQVQRTVNFVNSYHKILTSIASRPNTNIGAIVGGVVAAVIVLGLGAVLLWYFRRRKREITRRGRPPILASELNSPASGAPPDLQMATAFPSPFYAPSDTANPVPYIPQQTGRTPAQKQAVSTRKTFYDSARSGSAPSGTSYAPSDFLTSSSLPQIPPANANFDSSPSNPDAQRDSRVNEKSSHGWSQYTVQNLATPGPLPRSFYSNTAADGEPVEAGQMSRQMSTRSALPLYSPRGFQHDEVVPPLPGQ
jgi:hypothetical protein